MIFHDSLFVGVWTGMGSIVVGSSLLSGGAGQQCTLHGGDSYTYYLYTASSKTAPFLCFENAPCALPKLADQRPFNRLKSLRNNFSQC